MNTKDPDKFSGIRTLAKYSGVGLQLVCILGFGVGIGNYADKQVDPTSQTYTLVGTLIGLVVSLYFLFRLTQEVKDR